MPWFWFQIASLLLVISKWIVLKKIWEVHLLVVLRIILPTLYRQRSHEHCLVPEIHSLNLTWALREWEILGLKLDQFESDLYFIFKQKSESRHMRSFTPEYDCLINCNRIYRIIDVWKFMLNMQAHVEITSLWKC